MVPVFTNQHLHKRFEPNIRISHIQTSRSEAVSDKESLSRDGSLMSGLQIPTDVVHPW